VKRGDISTLAAGPDHVCKPRPAAILQEDRFAMTDSVNVCSLTTDPTDSPLFRLSIEPTDSNGLRETSRIMVDKFTTVPRAKPGMRIGRLADQDMVRLNRAVIVFLGIGSTAVSGPDNNRSRRS
jgi:mRNA interferase MazF